jgi:hypothetical protein
MTRESTGGEEPGGALTDWYKTNKKKYPEEALFLCYFRVDEVRPLVNELEQA